MVLYLLHVLVQGLGVCTCREQRGSVYLNVRLEGAPPASRRKGASLWVGDTLRKSKKFQGSFQLYGSVHTVPCQEDSGVSLTQPGWNSAQLHSKSSSSLAPKFWGTNGCSSLWSLQSFLITDLIQGQRPGSFAEKFLLQDGHLALMANLLRGLASLGLTGGHYALYLAQGLLTRPQQQLTAVMANRGSNRTVERKTCWVEQVNTFLHERKRLFPGWPSRYQNIHDSWHCA